MCGWLLLPPGPAEGRRICCSAAHLLSLPAVEPLLQPWAYAVPIPRLQPLYSLLL